MGSRWRIDEERIEEILGFDVEQFGELGDLTSLQRSFLRALANTGADEPQPANEIARLATATYGEKFPEKSLPKLVLHALEDAGHIKTTKTTTGRGAKPFLVTPTAKLVRDAVEPLLTQLASQTDPKLIALLRRPLPEVLVDLHSTDRHVAGPPQRMLTDPGDRVLDPFAGSCVTGEVAERLERRWICVEREEEYLRGAKGRFMPQPNGERTKSSGKARTREDGYYRIPHPGLLWNERGNRPLPPDGGRRRPQPETPPEAAHLGHEPSSRRQLSLGETTNSSGAEPM